MLIDSHCHLFTPAIVANVASKPGLAQSLHLDVQAASARLAPARLAESLKQNGVSFGLLLPTSGAGKVTETNDRFLAMAERLPALRTLCTLHPEQQGLDAEIRRMIGLGVPGVKLSSFSQRFDPCATQARAMFSLIEKRWSSAGAEAVVVLDTYNQAETHFGAPADHVTTPQKIRNLVERYDGIRFVAAHMGGLLADVRDIRNDLQPSPNLYLDTSNASHVLDKRHFVALLRDHGARRVLFGTDWPWFGHSDEIPRIRGLLAEAGFPDEDRARVFGGNALGLFRFGNC